MKSVKKNIVIIFSLLLLFLPLGSFILAQERPLEVPLPAIGEETEMTETPLLPDYIKYVFNFAIGIGGLVVFIVMIYGGFRYLTSAGNPSAMSDARDRIFSAFLGLALLLGSWLLLTTINPQLIIINPSLYVAGLPAVGNTPGVYLCKNAASIITSTDCQLYAKSAPKLGSFNNQTGYIKFVNDAFQYGVVLHENEYNHGRCRVCLTDGCDFSSVGGVSAITVFSQTTVPEGPGATFYEFDNYDEDGWQFGPITSASPYQNWDTLGLPEEWGRSIKIENQGKYLVALFQNTDMGGECEVFTASDPGLATNAIGICNGGFLRAANDGCFRSVVILPIGTKF